MLCRPHLLFVQIVLLVSLLVAAPGISTVSAQPSTLPDMRWRSPNWDFTVRWYSNEWTVAEDSASEGTDFLALTDTLGNGVAFHATTDFAGDAEACLDWLLSDAEARPGTANFQLARDAFGDPYVFRSPAQSYAVFTVQVANEDGLAQEYVSYAECQTLAPGLAVLQRVYSGPPAAFFEWYDDIVRTLESVFLAAPAWIADDPEDASMIWAGIAPLAERERIDAAFVLDATGRPELLVGLEAESGSSRLITFENISDSALAVAPAAIDLTLVALTGEVPERQSAWTAFRWEDGFVSDGEGTRVLSPGERASAAIDFAPVDLSGITCDVLPLLLLTYQPPGGAPIEFADGELPPELSDCLPLFASAATGRPVLQAMSVSQPPPPLEVTREPIFTAMDGRLDDLGRIPLARLTVAPGTAFAELPSGSIALYGESGTPEVEIDGVFIPLPAGELLTGDDGAPLLVHNTSKQEAVMLVLALEPTETWDTWSEEDPFRDRIGFTFVPLFPETNLLDRQLARRFTVETVLLPAGASLVPVPQDETVERALVLVERGSLTVESAEGKFGPSVISAGETASLPPGGAVSASEDGPASFLVVALD